MCSVISRAGLLGLPLDLAACAAETSAELRLGRRALLGGARRAASSPLGTVGDRWATSGARRADLALGELELAAERLADRRLAALRWSASSALSVSR